MDKPKLAIIGTDSNAFAILGKARGVAKANNMDWESIQAEATSGDYNNLLATMSKYFRVTTDGDDDEEDDEYYECLNCGDEVAEGEDFCSDECEDEYNEVH